MKGYFSGQDIGVWLRRLRAMSWKELLQLWRDPVLLFFIVYAFTVDIYNAGSGVTLQLNNAAFAVMDTDRSAASRELAGRFLPPHFNLMGQVSTAQQGQAMLAGFFETRAGASGGQQALKQGHMIDGTALHTAPEQPGLLVGGQPVPCAGQFAGTGQNPAAGGAGFEGRQLGQDHHV